jgi:cytochrome b
MMDQPTAASVSSPTTHLAQNRVSKQTRVWDLPTRVFHWTLAFCVIGSVVTGQTGGNLMAWHFRLGYCVLTLLLFRIVWGFVGGTWSRFSSFIYAPKHVLNYIKGKRDPLHEVGHNPLGGLSVIAMLLFLGFQVATGLVSDDEIASAGPLTRFLATANVQLATGYHVNIGKVILIVLALTHVAAILVYLFKKRENLIKPMLDGDKMLPPDVLPSRDTRGSRSAALAIFIVCAIVVYALVSLGG